MKKRIFQTWNLSLNMEFETFETIIKLLKHFFLLQYGMEQSYFFMKRLFKIMCLKYFVRNSDRGNGSHNVSLPMILKRIKVSQMLRSSCISLPLGVEIKRRIQLQTVQNAEC